MKNKIKKEWKEYAETVEADFIQDGFYAHDQVLKFIESKIDEVISHIGRDQGWEESEDIYRKHFGLELKYNKTLTIKSNKTQ